jgi:hypothetical protein
MVRKPAVAGSFYQAEENKLRKELENCFLSPLGPEELPQQPGNNRRILGGVVPHAGYLYSGPVAAYFYKQLYEDKQPDGFIILGPNHSGLGAEISIYPKGSWETPLGEAEVDESLAKAIESYGIGEFDTRAHAPEHSIEVQLPFLQFLYKKITFVPICMLNQNLKTAQKLGEALSKAIKSSRKDIVIIASTDFSHYISQEEAAEYDEMAIKKILALDPQGFIQQVHTHHISMCGYGPVGATMVATKLLKAQRAELLKYGTSGDVSSSRQVVGYAALSISL